MPILNFELVCMFVDFDQGKVSAHSLFGENWNRLIWQNSSPNFIRAALISKRQTKCAALAAQNLIKGVRLWTEICVFAVRRECVRNKLSHASKRARASVTFRLALSVLCTARIINNLILPQPVTRFETPHCSSRALLQLRVRASTEPHHTFDGFWTPIRFNYISPHLSLSFYNTREFAAFLSQKFLLSANWRASAAAAAAVNPLGTPAAAPLS